MGGRGSSGRGGSGGGAKMPALKGTEKQVAYAKDLRTKTLSALDSAEKEMMKIAPNEQAKEMAKSNLNALRNEVRSMTDASDVINTLKDVRFNRGVEDVLGQIAFELRARYDLRQSRGRR